MRAFAGNEGADAAKLGITGFCWGGRITWLYAAQQPNLKAGVAWYGRLVGEADPLHPKHPIDVAKKKVPQGTFFTGCAGRGNPATVRPSFQPPESRPLMTSISWFSLKGLVM